MKRERNAKNAGGTANSQLKVVSTFPLPFLCLSYDGTTLQTYLSKPIPDINPST